MSFIDVLIPALGGLFAIFGADRLVESSGDASEDAKRRRLLRLAGFVLLGVSLLYLVIKIGEGW